VSSAFVFVMLSQWRRQKDNALTSSVLKFDWLFKIQKMSNLSNFQKIGKNNFFLAKTKLSCERNRKNLKTENLTGLTELSAVFSKKLVILKNVLTH
jgi:hypothetical protein